MIKNYLTIAFRNLRRYRDYALINWIGLALGIASALFIFWIVRFELSYDNFHPLGNRVYRVNFGDKQGDIDMGSYSGLQQALIHDFPEVEKAAVLFRVNPDHTQIKVEEELFKLDGVFFAHPEFFEMTGFTWMSGDPQTSLSKPGQAVIDEATADKYFGGDALGKTFLYDNRIALTVSGILKEIPVNTDFPMQLVISHGSLKKYDPTYNEHNWNGWNSFHQTFILLKEEADPAALEAKFPAMMEKYTEITPDRQRYYGVLQPLSDIHFNPVPGNFNEHTFTRESLHVLLLIGFFLVITACVNFVNLATAHAVRRSKEVGIRKMLGSSKKQIFSQFIGETAFLTLFSVLLAVLIANQFFPYLQRIIGATSASEQEWNVDILLFLLALGIVVSLLAGFYPALVLSAFQPVRAVKNQKDKTSKGGVWLRRALVILQFTISQVLIICTLIALSQIHYFQRQQLGFDQEAIITFDVPERNGQIRERLRQQLLSDPHIKAVTFGLNTPAATINKWWTGVNHHSFAEDFRTYELKFVDEYYLDFYQIPVLAGQFLTPTDSNRVLLNETAVKDLGFDAPEEALGETVSFWGRDRQVIGVVQDFNTQSLHTEIHPVLISGDEDLLMKGSVRIDMENAAAAIQKIEQVWKNEFTDYYFEYAFLDDQLATFYREEAKLSKLLSLFTVVAIVIGCIGLYGLISFVTTQRTKEVGIRKALGASVASIVLLFSKEFVRLLIIAFVLAGIIGWYAMSRWLEDFAYRIDISAGFFLLAGGLTLLIALLTVSYQSVKAAGANPVDSLRNE